MRVLLFAFLAYFAFGVLCLMVQVLLAGREIVRRRLWSPREIEDYLWTLPWFRLWKRIRRI